MNRTFRAALGRRLLMAALLVVLTGGTGAQATSTDAVAVATGTTTITATGTARVRLHFPKDTTIDMDAVQLIPGAGTTRAFVLLRPETQACGDPRIPLCIFTLLGWVKGTTPNLGTSHEGDSAHNFLCLLPPTLPSNQQGQRRSTSSPMARSPSAGVFHI